MVNLKEDYKLPNESILDEVYDEELFEQRNDEFVEKIIQEIQESFYNHNLKVDLIGVSRGYNSTKLRYEYFDPEKLKTELPSEKIKSIISDATDSDKINVSDIVLAEPYENLTVLFTVNVQHQWLKDFSFSKLYSNAKPNVAPNFSFYGDVKGNPCFENINDCKLITIAGENEKAVTQTARDLLLATTFYFKPNELKFIIFDTTDYLDCFNGTPSMYFGRVEKDLNLLYETLIYLNNLASKRKDLLTQAKLRDIATYNENSEDKMEYIWVVINDFQKVREFYGPNAIRLCKYLVELTKLGEITGIHFLISSPHILGDPFSPEVRVAASLRLALKIENIVGRFMALGKKFPTSLSERADAFLYHYGKDVKRVIPATFRDAEALAICEHLNSFNEKDFHEKEYEYVKQLYEKEGLLGPNNTPEARRFNLIKEALRAGKKRGKINQTILQNLLFIEGYEAKSIMQELLEKNYIARNGFYYFVVITDEEFEKLFGEKF